MRHCWHWVCVMGDGWCKIIFISNPIFFILGWVELWLSWGCDKKKTTQKNDLKNEGNQKKSQKRTPFDLEGCIVLYITWLLPLTGTASQNQKCYQLPQPEIEFDVMEKMYAALCMQRCAENTIKILWGKKCLSWSFNFFSVQLKGWCWNQW